HRHAGHGQRADRNRGDPASPEATHVESHACFSYKFAGRQSSGSGGGAPPAAKTDRAAGTPKRLAGARGAAEGSGRCTGAACTGGLASGTATPPCALAGPFRIGSHRGPPSLSWEGSHDKQAPDRRGIDAGHAVVAGCNFFPAARNPRETFGARRVSA